MSPYIPKPSRNCAWQEMSRSSCRDPDVLMCAALEMLQEFGGASIEELDPDTQAAIARARGTNLLADQGRPWPESEA